MARAPRRKPGPKAMPFKETMSPEKKLDYMHKIIDLFETRQVTTLSEAADILGIPKMKVHRWRKDDKEFRAMLDVAEELIADELLLQLADPEYTKSVPKVTSIIFRLKKIRPEYRDNYKVIVTDSKAMEHLQKLQELLKKSENNQKSAETPSVEDKENK